MVNKTKQQRPVKTTITRSSGYEPPYKPNAWNNRSKPQIKATHNCYSYMLNDLHKIARHGKPQPGWALGKPKQSSPFNNHLNCKEITDRVLADNPQTIRIIDQEIAFHKPAHKNHYKGFLMISPGNDYHFARQDNRLITIYRKMHELKLLDFLLQMKKITLNNNTLHIKPNNKRFLAKIFMLFVNRYMKPIVELANTTFPKQMLTTKNPIKQLKHIHKCSFTWSHKPGATNATDKDASNNMILNPMNANWNYSPKGSLNYSENCCFFEIPNNNIADTLSTGVNKIHHNKRNNPLNIRKNISHETNDMIYQKLLKLVLS
uniref:Uncharacterized protein n=1 Tax=viral metagenome TaxID=1070528 RepID=A0A6C0F8Y8_9ZZZZ|tara:strand:+ start:10394 stop:11347 length:954 start_codon:yes stop_codon:yes gene_type:complete